MAFLLPSFQSRASWRTALVVALQLLGWGAYAGIYYFSLREYQPFPDIALKQSLVAAGLGLVVSSLLGGGYWRWEVSRMQPLKKTGIILLGSAASGVVWHLGVQWGSAWVNPFIVPVAPHLGLEGTPLLGHLSAYPSVLLVWSGFYFGIAYWREQQRQQEQLLQADAEAQRAQLRALRYQLNPHFFFNALNTIGALADTDPQLVKDVVRKLSGFLRYTLLDEEDLVTPLEDEVRAVEHYLAIEKIRFEDDLQVDVQMSHEAREQAIPSFLVLPLVENAVKHGQRTSPTPLRVHLTGTIENDTLVVEVANTGHWREKNGASSGTDTGLDNVRTRLQAQYPDRHDFTLTEAEGWVRARIAIHTDALEGHE